MATYAGQHKDGYACGVGVTTWVNGDRVYAEHDPKGEVDGRHLSKIANGDTKRRYLRMRTMTSDFRIGIRERYRAQGPSMIPTCVTFRIIMRSLLGITLLLRGVDVADPCYSSCGGCKEDGSEAVAYWKCGALLALISHSCFTRSFTHTYCIHANARANTHTRRR